MKTIIDLDVAELNTLASALAASISRNDEVLESGFITGEHSSIQFHASHEVLRARNIAMKCRVHNKVNRILKGCLSSITGYAIDELDRQGNKDSRDILYKNRA